MSTAFDIIIREQGIQQIVDRLKTLTSQSALAKKAADDLNNSLKFDTSSASGLSRTSQNIKSMSDSAKSAITVMNSLSNAVRNIPSSSNLNPFAGFSSQSASVIANLKSIAQEALNAKNAVDLLGVSLLTASSRDFAALIAQAGTLAASLRMAATASRDINVPRINSSNSGSGNGGPPTSAFGDNINAEARTYLSVINQTEVALRELAGQQRAYDSLLRNGAIGLQRYNQELHRINQERQQIRDTQTNNTMMSPGVSQEYNSIVNQTSGAVERLRNQQAALNVLFNEGRISQTYYNQAMQNVQAQMGSLNSRMTGLNNTAGLARHNMINLSYQLNDIVVSLYSGQRPMTVFIQQGAQIMQIMMAQGLMSGQGLKTVITQITQAIWGFIRANPELLAAIAAGVAAYTSFRDGVSETQGVVVGFTDVIVGMGQYFLKVADWGGYLTTTINGIGTAASTVGRMVSEFFPGLSKSIGDRAKKSFDTSEYFQGLKKQELLVGASPREKKFIEANEKATKEGYPLFDINKAYRDKDSGKLMFPEQLTKQGKPDPKYYNYQTDKIKATLLSTDTKERDLAVEKERESIRKQGEVFTKQEYIKMGKKGAYQKTEEQAIREKFKDQGHENVPDEVIKELAAQRTNQAFSHKATMDSLKKPKKPPAEKPTEASEFAKYKLEVENNIKALELYGDARKTANKLDDIDAAMTQKKLKLLPEHRTELKALIETMYHQQQVTQVTDALYEENEGAVQKLKIEEEGLRKALNDNVISLDQYNKKLAETKLKEAELNIERGKGTIKDWETIRKSALDAAKSVERYNDSYKKYQQSLIDRTIGAKNDNKAQTDALKDNKGLFKNRESYDLQRVSLHKEKLDNKFATGEATFDDAKAAALMKTLEGYKGVLAGLSENFGNFFSTISSGFADSIGKAIVMGDDLNESLGNVARQGLQQLISGLIQMGIQYLVLKIIGESLSKGTGASVATEAGLAATAWAPAAALASLATLGQNMTPAMTSLVATTALSQGLAAATSGLGGFDKGGYTGNMGEKEVAGFVHGQEYVVKASATKKHRPLLDAINSGRDFTPGASNSNSSYGGSSRAPSITINNMGTPQDYQVESITRDEIKLIAKDQAEKTVQKRTPAIVSKQISNPNSKISKSLGSSTNTKRKRTG